MRLNKRAAGMGRDAAGGCERKREGDTADQPKSGSFGCRCFRYFDRRNWNTENDAETARNDFPAIVRFGCEYL